jgi:hypothetical protein
MRILLALLICTAFIGGMQAYFHYRDHAAKPVKQFTRPAATGKYRLELTATFPVEPDPYGQGRALLLNLDGKTVLELKKRAEAGQALRVDPLPGVAVGENEFYFEANPPDDQLNQAHAVRVRIFRDEDLVGEHSLWSEPGTKLATTFPLKVAPAESPTKDAHDDH